MGISRAFSGPPVLTFKSRSRDRLRSRLHKRVSHTFKENADTHARTPIRKCASASARARGTSRDPINLLARASDRTRSSFRRGESQGVSIPEERRRRSTISEERSRARFPITRSGSAIRERIAIEPTRYLELEHISRDSTSRCRPRVHSRCERKTRGGGNGRDTFITYPLRRRAVARRRRIYFVHFRGGCGRNGAMRARRLIPARRACLSIRDDGKSLRHIVDYNRKSGASRRQPTVIVLATAIVRAPASGKICVNNRRMHPS